MSGCPTSQRNQSDAQKVAWNTLKLMHVRYRSNGNHFERDMHLVAGSCRYQAGTGCKSGAPLLASRREEERSRMTIGFSSDPTGVDVIEAAGDMAEDGVEQEPPEAPGLFIRPIWAVAGQENPSGRKESASGSHSDLGSNDTAKPGQFF